MNRTDRMLAIVLELHNRGKLRAEDLAGLFVASKRTIYRDIEAVCETGVPLIALPGRGYALMKGYFLPPLTFTPDEAAMLLLGSGFVAQNFDADYRHNSISAARKLEGVLPIFQLKEVRERLDQIRFITSPVEEKPVLKNFAGPFWKQKAFPFTIRAAAEIRRSSVWWIFTGWFFTREYGFFWLLPPSPGIAPLPD